MRAVIMHILSFIASHFSLIQAIIFFTLACVLLWISTDHNQLSFEDLGARPFPKLHPPKGKKGKEDKPKPKSKHDFALVKYSGVGATSISGKIGGTVFTAGGSMGTFLRNWIKVKNRRTFFQQIGRGTFSGVSSAWRSLTATQIDAWNASATEGGANSLRVNVFGDSRIISGKDMFERINYLNILTGNTQYSDPPTSAVTDSILSLAGTADVSSNQFDVLATTFNGATAVPADTTLVFEATPKLSRGKSFIGDSQYRTVGIYPATTATNPLDVYADYTGRFGALVAGTKIGFRAYFLYDDGAGNWGISGKVYGTVVVTA